MSASAPSKSTTNVIATKFHLEFDSVTHSSPLHRAWSSRIDRGEPLVPLCSMEHAAGNLRRKCPGHGAAHPTTRTRHPRDHWPRKLHKTLIVYCRSFQGDRTRGGVVSWSEFVPRLQSHRSFLSTARASRSYTGPKMLTCRPCLTAHAIPSLKKVWAPRVARGRDARPVRSEVSGGPQRLGAWSLGRCPRSRPRARCLSAVDVETHTKIFSIFRR